MIRIFSLNLIVLILFNLPLQADDTIQQSKAERLAQQLGHPIYDQRDAASRELWQMGEPARPALEATLQTGNAEAVRRARSILERFNLGLYPETPIEIQELVRQFQGNELEKQIAIIGKLIQQREKGVQALRGLLRSRSLSVQQFTLSQAYGTMLRKAVPVMLWNGEADLAESFLEIHLDGLSQQGWLDYALFARSRSHLDEMIRALERKLSRETVRSMVLVYLYRVNGQSDKALSLLQTLKLSPGTLSALARLEPQGFRMPTMIQRALFEDRGDWAKLLALGNGKQPETAAVRTFAWRLAGRDDIVQQHLDIQAQNNGASSRYGIRPSDDALSLLVNGRPDAGIELMRKAGTNLHILADVLVMRMEFDRLLTLLQAEQATQKDPLRKGLCRARLAELLAKLGRTQEAEAIFNVDAKFNPNEGEGMAFEQLIRSEVRIQRFDLACDHLATMFSRMIRNDPSIEERETFETVFGADSDTAVEWWLRLSAQEKASETPQQRMRLVYKLLHGQADAAELAEAIKRFRPKSEMIGNRPAFNFATPGEALALAVVQRAHGHLDAAIATLTKQADELAEAQPTPKEPFTAEETEARGSRGWVFGTDERFVFWVELGETLMDKNQPAEAAKRYLQGLAHDPGNPILHFLRGRALLADGQTVEGNRWITLSHQVTLGDPQWRARFLLELLNRGETAEVRIEMEQLQRCSWISVRYLGNVWSQMASAAMHLGEYTTASALDNRAIHFMLSNDAVSYLEGYAYLKAPIEARSHHARALLARGNVDAALVEAKECLRTLPGYDNLAIGMVPELDTLNRKADADALFRTVWEANVNLLKKHPKSAWAMASAAWVAAGCNRELDTGLNYARRAVELEPGNPAYQETLAEVLFRRHDRAAASAIMETLLAKHWRNRHYKRQLTRYRNGSFDSSIPDHDE